ncbi:MAG: dihydrodipicolinate synthase family protein [Verrucomicrobiales bacterium]
MNPSNQNGPGVASIQSEAAAVFGGCAPALMTPCDAEGVVNFDQLVATGLELIEAGMRSVIYCGSMGDWPLLTDEQRKEGVRLLVEAGVPVVVGTGAQNSRVAADLAAHAAEVGASGLMVIPRVLSRGSSPAAQREHFSAVLEAGGDLPAVIYNSPYYGFETRADLFFSLREKYKSLIGFKEFGGAASLSYAAEHITGSDPDLMLLVGVDTQVFHGYINCGASGAITGVGNALPKEILRYVELCERAAAGDAKARRYAAELQQALGVLSTFDEGPDLVLHYKELMTLEGKKGYEHQLYGTDKLSSSQRGYLHSQWRLFRDWWSSWEGASD